MLRFQKLSVGLMAAFLGIVQCVQADIIIKTDGTTMEGLVHSWGATIVKFTGVNGMKMEMPAADVSEIQIPGAEGFVKEAISIRAAMAAERWNEAADALSSALAMHRDSAVLGEAALKLLNLPPGTLKPRQLESICRETMASPAVCATIATQDLPISDDLRIQAGTVALQDLKGEEFAKAQTTQLKLRQAQITRAAQSNDTKLLTEALVGIGHLYGTEGTPVTTREEFRFNLDRSQVDHLRHAIRLIPLGPDFRTAGPEIQYLMVLASAGMQSAKDEALSRLEEYFHGQAMGFGDKYVKGGDFDQYVTDINDWQGAIPIELAGSARLKETKEKLRVVQDREGLAWTEWKRLNQLGLDHNPQFAAEIDSQLVRFKNSYCWTKQRVQELEQLRTAAVPVSPPPATDTAAQTNASTEAPDPFAGG